MLKIACGGWKLPRTANLMAALRRMAVRVRRCSRRHPSYRCDGCVSMIRMLIVGYVFAIRSKRRTCAEVRP